MAGEHEQEHQTDAERSAADDEAARPSPRAPTSTPPNGSAMAKSRSTRRQVEQALDDDRGERRGGAEGPPGAPADRRAALRRGAPGSRKIAVNPMTVVRKRRSEPGADRAGAAGCCQRQARSTYVRKTDERGGTIERRGAPGADARPRPRGSRGCGRTTTAEPSVSAATIRVCQGIEIARATMVAWRRAATGPTIRLAASRWESESYSSSSRSWRSAWSPISSPRRPRQSGRGFSLSRWWQSARRGMRGNQAIASSTQRGRHRPSTAASPSCASAA